MGTHFGAIWFRKINMWQRMAYQLPIIKENPMKQMNIVLKTFQVRIKNYVFFYFDL